MQTFLNNKFLNCALSYGLIRKAFYLQNATVKETYYNKKTNEIEDYRIPVFITDKIGITIISGFSAIYLWPLYVYIDLRNYEIYKSPDDKYRSFKKEKDTLIEHLIF